MLYAVCLFQFTFCILIFLIYIGNEQVYVLEVAQHHSSVIVNELIHILW